WCFSAVRNANMMQRTIWSQRDATLTLSTARARPRRANRNPIFAAPWVSRDWRLVIVAHKVMSPTRTRARGALALGDFRPQYYPSRSQLLQPDTYKNALARATKSPSHGAGAKSL